MSTDLSKLAEKWESQISNEDVWGAKRLRLCAAELRAALAARNEKMKCGHIKANWIPAQQVPGTEGLDYFCPAHCCACAAEEERVGKLVEALRETPVPPNDHEAAQQMTIFGWMILIQSYKEWYDRAQSILRDFQPSKPEPFIPGDPGCAEEEEDDDMLASSPAGEIEPVHPWAVAEFDTHTHKPGKHCQGCADLFERDRKAGEQK